MLDDFRMRWTYWDAFPSILDFSIRSWRRERWDYDLMLVRRGTKTNYLSVNYSIFQDTFQNASTVVISVSWVFIWRSIDESCTSDYGWSGRSIEYWKSEDIPNLYWRVVLWLRRMMNSVSKSTFTIVRLDIWNIDIIFSVGRSRNPRNLLHFPHHFCLCKQVCEEIL